MNIRLFFVSCLILTFPQNAFKFTGIGNRRFTLLILRSLLFNILFWINTVILSSIVLILRPFGIKVVYLVGKTWSRLNLLLLRLICGITYELRIEGELPKGPAVYLAKHQSAWETVAFPTFLPPFMWVLKKELFYIPVFGWCLYALGHIGINRTAGAKAIKQINEEGKKILSKGFNIVIFPEGTRVAPGKMGDFNPGGVGLAINNSVPIIPVSHNAGRLWRRRSFAKLPGKITVILDNPIPTADIAPSERKKMAGQVKEIIEGRMKEIEG